MTAARAQALKTLLLASIVSLAFVALIVTLP